MECHDGWGFRHEVDDDLAPTFQKWVRIGLVTEAVVKMLLFGLLIYLTVGN